MAFTGAKISTGIGLRHVRVALRDTDGTFKIPSGTAVGTAYAGLQIQGAAALTITVPDPQRVTARGDDRPYYTFQLPPTDMPTGELRVSKTQADIVALLTDTEQFGSPPFKKIGIASNKQGEEPTIILWGSRQAIDSDDDSSYFGTKVWQTYVLLACEAALRPAAMEDAAVGEFTYSIAANDASVDEFGASFTEAIHGFTKCPYLIVTSRYKFWIDVFTLDGIETDFTLTKTPVSSGGEIVIAQNGVNLVPTTDWTRVAKVVTLDDGSATGEKLVVEYDYE